MHSADRELAVADAVRQALGVACRGILAVGGDELGERGEQAGLREAIAVDSIETRLGPGLSQIAEGRPSLLRMILPRRESRTRTRPGAHDRPPIALRATMASTLATCERREKSTPFRKVNSRSGR